jgi:hypothetical protein
MNVKRGANMKRKLWKSPYFRFNNPEQYTPENNNEIVFAFFCTVAFFLSNQSSQLSYSLMKQRQMNIKRGANMKEKLWKSF